MSKSDFKIAKELREKWGDRPCKCENLIKERMCMGQLTGDKYCANCGEWFTMEDLAKRGQQSNT